jgi:formate dehydrogenase maturation protein FdhE
MPKTERITRRLTTVPALAAVQCPTCAWSPAQVVKTIRDARYLRCPICKTIWREPVSVTH